MTREDTLLELFEPPEDLYGHSAALVAMTAGEDFLDAAMERFLGLRARRRAELGTIHAYLMLDPHESPERRAVLRPGQVPGMHELQPRPVARDSLLHAKLALLGFARTRTGAVEHLRLAVLTANYTYTSARHQLELVFVLDVPLAVAAAPVDRADLIKAAAFVKELVRRRFYREPGITERLDELVKACALPPTNVRPRFVHSLDEPLLGQIEAGFKKLVDGPRNVLVCGSGFYEQPTAPGKKPAILKKLERLVPFTARPERCAIVEPTQAGALAPWIEKAEGDGWMLREPLDVLGLSRRLHAKFIYVGRAHGDHVVNGCLYLGSGNLSIRGLTTAGQSDGNIECGVVVPVPDRLDHDAVAAHLFWGWGLGNLRADEVAVGDVVDEAPPEALITPPPILSARIELEPARALRLRWRDDVAGAATITIGWPGRDPAAVAPRQEQVPLGDGEAPRALDVSSEGRTWQVPVVDPHGRVAWEPRQHETFDGALDALLDFPSRPAESDDDGDDGGESDDGDDDGALLSATAGAPARDSKTYALHAAATLIEQVAEHQRALEPPMLDGWLDHLDRTLRGFPPTFLQAWRAHRIDVFKHLAAPALAPRGLGIAQRRRYLGILETAALAWGVR